MSANGLMNRVNHTTTQEYFQPVPSVISKMWPIAWSPPIGTVSSLDCHTGGMRFKFPVQKDIIMAFVPLEERSFCQLLYDFVNKCERYMTCLFIQ